MAFIIIAMRHLFMKLVAEANWVDKQIKTYLNGKNPELGIWYDAEDKDMLERILKCSLSYC